jgi:hypothetical protein
MTYSRDDGFDPTGEDPRTDWRVCDDTLADGPVPEPVGVAKRWLAEQRFVHGLLRGMNTADAAAREGRVAAILQRIDQERRGALPRRHWAVVATAALLLAALATWWSLPQRLPTADAAVLRAVAELSRAIDRRFHIEIEVGDGGGKPPFRQEFAMVARPGSKFRLDGKLAIGTFQLGELRIGCDGQELWVLPANGMFRRAVPLADHEQLLQGFGSVLDLGYLDVHDFVAKLPADFDLEVLGREMGSTGRSEVVLAGLPRQGARSPLRSLRLQADEDTGMVTRIEAESDGGRGVRRIVRIAYQGTESPSLVDYRRPW